MFLFAGMFCVFVFCVVALGENEGNCSAFSVLSSSSSSVFPSYISGVHHFG